MNQTILLIGTDIHKMSEKLKDLLDELELKFSENNPDLFIVVPQEKKKTVGISQTKQIIKFLATKPHSHKSKAVVVPNAKTLTVSAQNSLLKISEEPPPHAFIFLCAQTEGDLLPTVISRCMKIRVGDSSDIKTEEYIKVQDVLIKGVGERLSWASETAKKDRGFVIEMLNIWITALRERMHAKNSNLEILSKDIRYIVSVKKDLENTNVSLKLALEYLVTMLE